MIKRNVLTGLILSSALTAGMSTVSVAAPTEKLSGNVTATSTYIWRGLAQTVEAALQGGVEADFGKGIYAGAWTSTVLGGSEVDVYAGYKGKADIFNYDAGAILYFYPNEPSTQDLNFLEAFIDVSRDFYGAKLSISSDAGTYIEGYATIPVEHWNLGLHVGRYSIEKDYDGFIGAINGPVDEDFFDFKIAIGKDVGGFDLEFALSDTNLPNELGDFRTAITVSKDFTP